MTSRIELLDHQSRDQIRDILNSNGIAEEITRSEVREAYGDDLASGALYLAKLKIDDILIGQRMAELYLDTIRTVRAEGRQPVLGFFTGSTGETGYGTLVQRSKMEGISWADVITFNMDEYAGVDPDDAMSYIRFMREHLFNHVDIDLNNTHFPTTELWQTYDDNIASFGGLDIQGGGIGIDGHMAFVGPGTPRTHGTMHIKNTEATKEANSRYGEVPSHSYTMGPATLLAARQLVLFITGYHKAVPIRNAISGPITEDVPASLVREHSNGMYVIDGASASQLGGLNGLLKSQGYGNHNLSLRTDAPDDVVRQALHSLAEMTPGQISKELARSQPMLQQYRNEKL